MLDARKAVHYCRHVTPPLTVEAVRAALIAANGSPKAAGELLGVSRQTIHDWMKKHDIRVERRVVVAAKEVA